MRKRISYRRMNIWFVRGYEDALCGVCRDMKGKPKLIREAYDTGHLQGLVVRPPVLEVA